MDLRDRQCLIIGAGPAGGALATHLSREGARVTLIDRRPRIEQKICGESLSPPCRELLEELRVWSKIPESSRRSVTGVTLVSVKGARCRLDFGEDPMHSIPRPVLDQVLLDEAREVGARIELGVTATGLSVLSADRGYRVGGRRRDGKPWEWSGELLFGADGRHSWVARGLGLAPRKEHSLRHVAVMGHFRVASDRRGLSEVEMHVTPWGYTGVNALPGEGDLSVIAVLEPDELKRRLRGRGSEGLLALLMELTQGADSTPSLRRALETASPLTDQIWTVGPMAWIPRKIIANNGALLGDSAGFVDPFTGEGLYHALSSAAELRRALVEEAEVTQALRRYARWHRHRFLAEEVFCSILQRLLPHRSVADYLVRQLGAKPHLSQTLALAVGDRIPTTRVLSPLYWAKVLSRFHSKKDFPYERLLAGIGDRDSASLLLAGRVFSDGGVGELDPAETRRFQALFRATGVQRRALWLEAGDARPHSNPDDFHRRYVGGIREIAPRAAREALRRAGVRAEEIDFIVFVSCTGYTCPGFALELAGTLGIPAQSPTANLVGMGCSALVPGLDRAVDRLRASLEGSEKSGRRAQRALVIAAEICSSTYWIDRDPETVVGNALFADGAAAVVLSSVPSDLSRGISGTPRARVEGFRTLRDGRYLDDMGFTQQEGRLRVRLAREIPARIFPLVESMIGALELTPEDRVVLHPGGRKILDGVEASLTPRATGWSEVIAWSRGVMRDFGNMSSPTSAFVLERSFEERPLRAKDERGALITMGPGLSVEAVTLTWLSL